MTEEIKQHNFELFIKKLNQLGIDTSKLVENLGEKLKNGSFSTSTSTNLAGDGTLIDTILKVLTPFAVRINNLLDEDKRVDQNILVKVCLLHQISKSVEYIPTNEDWLKKKGYLYEYSKDKPAIKTGLYSLILCQENGITFTPAEAEAMTINDRRLDDEQANFYSSKLSEIVKIANSLTYISKKN